MIQGIRCYVYWDDSKNKIMFCLLEDIYYLLLNGDNIIVPAGYRTDFATIPNWATWLLKAVDKHCIAAILHDWMYDTRYNENRKFADDEFLRVMKEYNVAKWQRNIMYFGVRVGAKGYWNRKSFPNYIKL